MFKNNKIWWVIFVVVTIPLAYSVYFMHEQEKEFEKLGESIRNIRVDFEQLKRERETLEYELQEMRVLEEQTTEDMRGFQ